ncbi:MAG: hypothetical protein AB199_00660 [Parcubacteria bacterium C7867-004]|nr:MAG: hypothetical protein AB199_00660 [Parcubacteria bacterium C7867-004]
MRYDECMKTPRGMTLVDVLVGSALVLIIFLALLGLLRASLLISSAAKLKSGATALATTQMEYLRSLPYDSVGTVGGIPAGAIPQNTTSTLNGVTYVTRTFIEYVDDAKDGQGVADSNGIMTDYKRARVSVSYMFRESDRELVLVSNIAPPSIETTTGGGTLRINVVNAAGDPVAGASVRVQNPSAGPAIDFTTFSDATGVVMIPGAPPSTDYRITASKDGYSTAVTYARDATNQNPTPGYLTIVAGQTTSSTFAIDVLGALVMRTFSSVRPAFQIDSFDDGTHLASVSGTQAAGGALVLSGAPGSYALSGSARSTSTAPTYLKEWRTVDADEVVPAGTGIVLRVAASSGTLVPDAMLPGNTVGFSSFPIDISGIATTTYPSLSILADLSTSDALMTPQVLEWSIHFDEGPIPLPNRAFTLTGAKVMGTTGAGAAIPKTIIATTTDASGRVTIPLEWDVYTFDTTVGTLISESEPSPYTLEPAENRTVDVILQ